MGFAPLIDNDTPSLMSFQPLPVNRRRPMQIPRLLCAWLILFGLTATHVQAKRMTFTGGPALANGAWPEDSALPDTATVTAGWAFYTPPGVIVPEPTVASGSRHRPRVSSPSLHPKEDLMQKYASHCDSNTNHLIQLSLRILTKKLSGHVL